MFSSGLQGENWVVSAKQQVTVEDRWVGIMGVISADLCAAAVGLWRCYGLTGLWFGIVRWLRRPYMHGSSLIRFRFFFFLKKGSDFFYSALIILQLSDLEVHSLFKKQRNRGSICWSLRISCNQNTNNDLLFSNLSKKLIGQCFIQKKKKNWNAYQIT